MPFNGSGVFERLYSWVTDLNNGTKIIALRHDQEDDGFAAALNDVVDGTQGFIGPVKGTNGTAASPAFSFTDDTDTGAYRVSADVLGFAVSGTLEMKVEAGYVDAVNGLKIGGVAVTSTAAELNYVDGVTSNVQTQLDAKLVAASNLSDVANAGTARTNLGLGSISTQAASNVSITGGSISGITDLAIADGGTGSSTASAARTALGVAIGTDVQAYDADTLKADTHDTLTAGFDSDIEALGTITIGTVTPEVDADTKENFKTLTANGAFTLAPPFTSSNCTIIIQVTNGASAGTITTSGFTIVNGDDYDTTNGNDFLFHIKKVGSFSSLTIEALQ